MSARRSPTNDAGWLLRRDWLVAGALGLDPDWGPVEDTPPLPLEVRTIAGRQWLCGVLPGVAGDGVPYLVALARPADQAEPYQWLYWHTACSKASIVSGPLEWALEVGAIEAERAAIHRAHHRNMAALAGFGCWDDEEAAGEEGGV